jgi:hypothetical protein
MRGKQQEMKPENQDVLLAFKESEARIVDRLHKHTVALQVNNVKLEMLVAAVDRHRVILFGHEENDKPGLITRIHTIENADKERRWTVRTVSVAFFGMLGKYLYDLFNL